MATTGLAGAPIVEVSSLTGQGIAALRSRLDAAADAHADDHAAHRALRYAVDRAFSVAGSGTVVTGTVFQGAVRVGDHVVAVADGPRSARARHPEGESVAAEHAQARASAARSISPAWTASMSSAASGSSSHARSDARASTRACACSRTRRSRCGTGRRSICTWAPPTSSARVSIARAAQHRARGSRARCSSCAMRRSTSSPAIASSCATRPRPARWAAAS